MRALGSTVELCQREWRCAVRFPSATQKCAVTFSHDEVIQSHILSDGMPLLPSAWEVLETDLRLHQESVDTARIHSRS